MTTLREAATAALEALVRASSYYDTYAEISALEAALAEPVEEFASIPGTNVRVRLPVQERGAAWENKYGMKEWEVHALRAGWMPAPPQRKPEINSDYERGFVDGMSEQARRSVDRVVNAMTTKKTKLLTGQEYADIYEQCADWDDFARAVGRAHGIT